MAYRVLMAENSIADITIGISLELVALRQTRESGNNYGVDGKKIKRMSRPMNKQTTTALQIS